MLQDWKEIAVKRLSKNSRQGLHEFKNEVVFISRLQHRNLVKLLGCYIHGEEKMLVYEYMFNKSLDFFIFGSTLENPNLPSFASLLELFISCFLWLLCMPEKILCSFSKSIWVFSKQLGVWTVIPKSHYPMYVLATLTTHIENLVFIYAIIIFILCSRIREV